MPGDPELGADGGGGGGHGRRLHWIRGHGQRQPQGKFVTYLREVAVLANHVLCSNPGFGFSSHPIHEF
jgi:hypothetical protein